MRRSVRRSSTSIVHRQRRSVTPARSIRWLRRAAARPRQATRLAQFLSAADKEYEADIELGVSTTTQDRGGEIVERAHARAVSELTAADDRRCGRRIPRHLPSAASGVFRKEDRRRSRLRSRAEERARAAAAGKGHGGRARGARLARQQAASCDSCVRPAITCASLAHALGEALGTGGHLAGLVRTRSGEFRMAQAVGLDVLDREPERAAARVIPLVALLRRPARDHADGGGRVAGRARRLCRARACEQHRDPAPPFRKRAACGCFTPTAIWLPSPSPAPGAFQGFCIQGWYWNKINSFGTSTLRRTGAHTSGL